MRKTSQEKRHKKAQYQCIKPALVSKTHCLIALIFFQLKRKLRGTIRALKRKKCKFKYLRFSFKHILPSAANKTCKNQLFQKTRIRKLKIFVSALSSTSCFIGLHIFGTKLEQISRAVIAARNN